MSIGMDSFMRKANSFIGLANIWPRATRVVEIGGCFALVAGG